jgi:hypothetical protein
MYGVIVPKLKEERIHGLSVPECAELVRGVVPLVAAHVALSNPKFSNRDHSFSHSLPDCLHLVTSAMYECSKINLHFLSSRRCLPMSQQ